MEPKRLPPSMKTSNRYIVFEILSDSPVDYGDIITTIWSSIIDFLGESIASKANVWMIQNLYDKETQKGVIKCGHELIEEIRTSLSLIYMIGEIKSTIKILGVTGTIKSAKNKYLDIKDLRNFYTKP